MFIHANITTCHRSQNILDISFRCFYKSYVLEHLRCKLQIFIIDPTCLHAYATGVVSTLFPRYGRGVLLQYPPDLIPTHPYRVLGFAERCRYLGEFLHLNKKASHACDVWRENVLNNNPPNFRGLVTIVRQNGLVSLGQLSTNISFP